MVNKDFLLFVETLSNEKNISRESVFLALEAALASALRKKERFDKHLITIEVSIDRSKGDYRAFKYTSDASEAFEADTGQPLPLEDIPDHLVTKRELEAVDLGRIGTQIVRQVIIQKVREAENEQLASEFKDRIGELVTGQVKRVNRDELIIALTDNDKAEAVLKRDQMLPRDVFRVNDRVRAILQDIRVTNRRASMRLSRIDPAMIAELFTLEVPEIAEQVIEIKSIARDAGARTKVAVKTSDKRIDAVGSCVGMRGTRVQVISDELSGERIDVIEWDDDPVQMVINAMAPAEITSVIVDEETHTIDLAVTEDKLAQAIGRNGQNVRLASELIGWTINVMTDVEASEKSSKENNLLQSVFTRQLDIDAEFAQILIDEGFTSVEEVAYVSLDEMLEIEGFDEDLANELQKRAKHVLLNQAFTETPKDTQEQQEQEDDLAEVEGMTKALISALNQVGIASREALADLGLDELLELLPDLDNEKASQLIMSARNPWFS